mmetsp:Transcript_53716/g.105039  ORF Transcript_53716/g.105039 Transcript_53716/m.105039 type:complete len:303 (-) Transcript_53716:122-1030(-)
MILFALTLSSSIASTSLSLCVSLLVCPLSPAVLLCVRESVCLSVRLSVLRPVYLLLFISSTVSFAFGALFAPSSCTSFFYSTIRGRSIDLPEEWEATQLIDSSFSCSPSVTPFILLQHLDRKNIAGHRPQQSLSTTCIWMKKEENNQAYLCYSAQKQCTKRSQKRLTIITHTTQSHSGAAPGPPCFSRLCRVAFHAPIKPLFNSTIAPLSVTPHCPCRNSSSYRLVGIPLAQFTRLISGPRPNNRGVTRSTNNIRAKEGFSLLPANISASSNAFRRMADTLAASSCTFPWLSINKRFNGWSS